ncbi:uncharacterized protein LOC123267848 [Cotesia glomerata]|uniref:uncharacterized protein LOC123267848 n=1 Tax=Cotesia glomerata TaxID=32391 RepID=UPI001D02A45D|nr:uncharacterized protein LOC123267848 [Cotesia glomerata]
MPFKLFGCCIFVSLFFAYIACIEDIKIPSKKKDQRINLVNELMEQCFDIQASILITDSPSNSFVNELDESMPQSVLFLNKSAIYNIPTNQNTPVPSIIMILSSPAAMEHVLVNEAWRNFNQYFIILDGNNGNGCISAQSFLMEAWKNDILNVVFICLDHQNQVPKIYSFNPFTNSAPMSWMKISVVSAINNHSWTLFSQNYTAGDTLCSDLFYKKNWKSCCSQLQENEAFAEIETLLYPLVTENCHMPKKPLIPEKHYCYITQRNWPIFPEINEKLLMLIESGLNDYYIKKVLARYQHSKHQEPEQYQVLTMDHMKCLIE